MVLGSTSFAGKTIYVDADATGAKNGISWADAYVSLQDAIADANFSAKPAQILVAAGIYKPDKGVNQTPGSREATFRLINDVTIQGGFAGFGQPDPNARDFNLYKSVLSGDLKGNDSMNIWVFELNNSYHVTTGSGTEPNAVLDGFTITGGQGPQGGGMYNDSGSPTITNCTFSGNDAHIGAGMYNINGGNPTLIMCVFRENYVSFNQLPGSGGGMYNQNSNPVLIDCAFSGNVALSQCIGGAVANYQSYPTLIRCVFIANSAEGTAGELALGGGAIFNDQSGPTLINCIFSANSAINGSGGGINSVRSTTILINCTFAANRSLNGNALACWQSWLNEQPELSLAYISNSIIWGDSYQIWNGDGSIITISYTDMQGGQTSIYDPNNAVVWGDGNINADPNFARPGYWASWNDLSIIVSPTDPGAVWVDGDYHLQSEAGRWDPKSSLWINDEVTSPCIDAGDVISPFDLEPLPNGDRINMGAYGGTAEASKSPSPVQPVKPGKGK